MRLGVLRFNFIYLALVPARKQFIDENKLTFMKPLDESPNNDCTDVTVAKSKNRFSYS